MKKKIYLILTILLYSGFVMAMVLLIREKKNYHLDEVLTFVLANDTYDTSIIVSPDYYHRYDDPSAVWTDRITVQEGKRFDLKNVWEKQAADNHPPFYYVLINAVSSLMPGKYSKWIGGGINIFLGLLALFFFGRLAKRLIDDELFVLIASGAFALSAGVLSSVTYFRMYLMAMLFVILLSIVLTDGLKKRDYKLYIKLFLVSVAGTLTHYYFFIYLFAACLIFGIYLVIKKEWKSVLAFIGTMALSGGAVYLIFPGIIRQTIGGGYRGNEVLDNLKHSSFFYMIKQCFKVVDDQLFGGLFLIFMGLSAAILVVGLIIRKKKTAFDEVYKWILLWGASLIYFIAVSKVTVYIVARYYFPFYGTVILMFVATLYMAIETVKEILKKGNRKKMGKGKEQDEVAATDDGSGNAEGTENSRKGVIIPRIVGGGSAFPYPASYYI